MFLNVSELERAPVVLDQVLPPAPPGSHGSIDFGEEIRQVAPLAVHGRAELVAEDIRLRGDLNTVLEVPCARCLERMRRPVALDFDLFYRSVRTIAREEEVEITRDDLEIGFYHGCCSRKFSASRSCFPCRSRASAALTAPACARGVAGTATSASAGALPRRRTSAGRPWPA